MVESNTITWALIVYEILNRIAHSCVYLSASAFHYQIADPDIGGIYMTLLNSGKYVKNIKLTRKNSKSITRTLTAVVFLHYRVSTKMALGIGYTNCKMPHFS